MITKICPDTYDIDGTYPAEAPAVGGDIFEAFEIVNISGKTLNLYEYGATYNGKNFNLKNSGVGSYGIAKIDTITEDTSTYDDIITWPNTDFNSEIASGTSTLSACSATMLPAMMSAVQSTSTAPMRSSSAS